MPKKYTSEEEKALENLKAQKEQIEAQIETIEKKPTTYGYVRVSSRGQARDGNSLEEQERAVKEAGAEFIYKDVYTGTTTDRPELDKLLKELNPGDTIICTKLDRMARSVSQGVELIDGLVEKGINVNVLNMGRLDNTPTGRLIRNVMLSFAEFERDMIMQRTREGKEYAKQNNPSFREGRPPKFTKEQIDLALELLQTHSYNEVVKKTGISKSTLINLKKKKTR